MLRNIFIFIFAFLVMSNSVARQPGQPKVAVVLSGGGAKGFAHIGVLKILEEQDIPVDIIVGTSIGAIVGGLYSIGYTADEIELMARSQDWSSVLSDDVSRTQLSHNRRMDQQRFVLSIPTEEYFKPTLPQGAIRGQNVLNLLAELSGNVPVDANFNDFPIPFACVGTDITTGEEIVINNGFFPTAIYSSMSIPGAFVPLEHNGHVMIDGGIANNFPSDVAKKMGADIIIGVDIRNDLHDLEDIKSVKQIMDQLINFYSLEKDSVNKSLCSVIIRPDITGYSVSSFTHEAVDTLIERGKRAATDLIPRIREIKNEYNLSSRSKSREYVSSSQWEISEISLEGVHYMNDKQILDNLNLDMPGVYTYADIKEAIDRVYGLGCFEIVYFSFEGNESGRRTLKIHLEERSASGFNLGFRLNTFDAVSMLLNYSQYDYKRYIGYYSVTADISSNPGLNIYGEISKGNLPVIGVDLTGNYQEYKIYTSGRKTSATELYHGEGKIFLNKSIDINTIAGIGFNLEYFNGTFFNIQSDSLVVFPNTSTTIPNIYAYYHKDNLDDYYFPSRGVEFYSELAVFDDDKIDHIYPSAMFRLRSILPVTNNFSILLNVHIRGLFSEDFPIMKQTFVGGHSYDIHFGNHLPFYGIPPIMPAMRYTYIGLAGTRIILNKNHYLSIMANAMVQADDIAFGGTNQVDTGYAFQYNFRSSVGPIGFNLAFSPWYRQPVFSANAGLWF